MTEIKIEKGVPMPDPHPVYKGYPFLDMQPGDSFAAPRIHLGMIRSVEAFWAERHGWRFQICTVVENGQKMVRVWRMA